MTPPSPFLRRSTTGTKTRSDDEDDDISLTSTILSDDRDEYEVETILAELTFPEGVKYLVKWAGYPEDRCTWEPSHSFHDQKTLRSWKKKRAAIDRGELPAFDIDGWEGRLKKIVEAHDDRKRRRRAKRIRLGLSASSAEIGHNRQNDTGFANQEADEAESKKIKQEETESDFFLHTSPRKQVRFQFSPSENTSTPSSPVQPRSDNPRKQPAQRQKDKPQSSSKPYLINNPAQDAHPSRNPETKVTDSLQADLSENLVSPIEGEKPLARRSVSFAMARAPGRFTRSLRELVQAHRREAKTDNQSPTSPKLFKTLSTRNRFGKAAQHEPIPDISQLELRRPSDWSSTTSLDLLLAEREQRKRKFSDDSSPITREKSPLTDRPTTPVTPSLSTSREINQPPSKKVAYSPTVSLDSRQEQLISPRKVESTTPIAPRSHQSEQTERTPPTKPSRFRDSAPTMGAYAVRRPSTGAADLNSPDTKLYRLSKNRFWKAGEVLCNFTYGPEQTDTGPIRICGLISHVRKRLVDMKKHHRIDVWFQHLCTLKQYEILSIGTRNEKFCNGWVEAFSDTLPEVDKMANYLRERDLVGIFCVPGDSPVNVLLAYPSRSMNFDFLDGHDDIPENVSLRVAVRGRLRPFEFLRNVSTPEPTDEPQEKQGHNCGGDSLGLSKEPEPLTCAVHTENTLAASPLSKMMDALPNRVEMDVEMVDSSNADSVNPDIDLDDLFKDHFGITFAELATVNSPKDKGSAKAFFLMFPTDAQGEFELLSEFLKRHKVVIFSNRLPEDWERFAKIVVNGVVLFHESFLDYYELPCFLDVMRKSVNFWNVSLFKPLQIVDRQMNFQRIFPHGGVILLTEDFFANEQDASVIALMWFADFVKSKPRGNWKLMLRPDVLNWLSNRFDSNKKKSKDRHLVMYQLIKDIVSEGDVRRFPCDPRDLDAIYHHDLEHPIISPARLPNYGYRSEDEHPNIPKGLNQVQRDADHLVEFFAGWGIINCHKYRRFIVVTSFTEPLTRWKNWNHLELRCGARNFFKNFNIDYKNYWARITAQSKSAISSPPLSSNQPSDIQTTSKEPQQQERQQLEEQQNQQQQERQQLEEHQNQQQRQAQQQAQPYSYPTPYI